MQKESEYSSNMARKPAKNHPWKNGLLPKVANWAADSSETGNVNSWKVGGGKKQK